jgi:hypothetical protein
MNELSEARALRADAPLPDADRLAPQRARLVEAFRQETGGVRAAAVSRPRRRIVLVTAAATGALAVTGGAVVLLPDDTAAGNRQSLPAHTSVDTLELAAAVVEKKHAVEPGAKQWVYEKTTTFHQGKPQASEQWTRWDGTGSAQLPGIAPSGDITGFDPNKLQVWYGPNQEEKWKEEGYDDRSQRQFYRFLATLPSDEGRMMKRIRQEQAIGSIEGETAAERAWREISVLYRSVVIPPKVQAGLFRALAKIPGARSEKGVKDPLGRAAISVSVDYPERTASGRQGKQELFFDQRTYVYLGEVTHVPPMPVPAGMGEQTKPGQSDDGNEAIITARAAWGVVNKPGARP